MSDQEHRYQKISEHLAQIDTESLSQPWKMGFEYVPDGILIEGVRYPILKMDWVEGLLLSQWLSIHHQDQASVMEVARKFEDLAHDLHRNNIAHGDLQHGNLLVAQDRTLRLVDYDGLFVPALSGERGNEIGHRNYQSPRRTLDDFGPDMDNFSAWVIHASLIAVAEDPTLWSQLHDADGEYLLLSGDDFSDPSSSTHFPDLLRHANPVVNASMSQLSALCEKRLAEIPRLHWSQSSTDVDTELHVPSEGTSGDVADTQPGRPSWLDSHLTTNTLEASFSTISFQGWHLREFLLALLGVLTVTAPLIMGMTGYLHFGAIVLGALTMSSVFFVLSAAARFKRGEIKMLRNNQRSLDQLLALNAETVANYEKVHEERARLIVDEQGVIERNISQNQELTNQLHQSYARIESDRKAASDALKQELRNLRDERDAAFAERLRPLQQPWVQKRLPSFLLSEAHLSGITSKHISSLAALNLRTAADIVGIKRVKGGDDALLMTGDGRCVKVPGVGPVKAESLYAWHQECEETARESCPVSLPADDEAEIEGAFEPLFASVLARQTVVDQEAERRRSEARKELAVIRTRLADTHQEKLAALRARSEDLDLLLSDMRASASDVYRLNQSKTLLMMSARKISYLRYLRFLYLR
ncbi:hypothetical protein [Streptomyces sp. H51]|uniref:hypothetical protein n=1 Tax=Streptomyces sp. H51 TaxID=3111770 RepID=UPI002D779796|nr:hypothetical protein [Streptomyces sp. H51]